MNDSQGLLLVDFVLTNQNLDKFELKNLNFDQF